MNWYDVYRRLFHRSRLSAETVDNMTLPELSMALDDDLEKSTPQQGERKFRSAAERDEWVKWLRGLTVEERLKAVREGLL